ncbi:MULTISPECIES: hotdog fold thioesterase [unclassified Motilimonas]|uniref:hotdog fold thioesterase n=1 Tax=Motilimonas TaxID=1914248 RepID=UPI001E495B47|nr:MULTISPECIES: hotdog fold thioesterase [unclassified Motilimonas]MCE0556392.1 hotdog fold thioesterase [Motilimonas sp. E26]MDO6525838.1 hotdog fold thioesterase [Motilimonas sp. 1_MG-2023]
MAKIWQKPTDLARLNALSEHTLVSHLQIQYTELGDDYLVATMPVTSFTHQPFGLLHGGASVVLAETLGSVAGNLAAPTGRVCVGQEINANHLRSVRSGFVVGQATAVYIGGRSQVWNINISDDKSRLICCSRLTLAVLAEPKA